MKKYYDKLVRDKIPNIIKEAGKNAQVRPVSPEKFKAYALTKLREEVEEFIDNPCAEEAADILEILYTICEHHDVRPLTIETERISKRVSKGAFDSALILEWVDED